MLQLEQMNEAQRKAVMHGEGPLLVLAGPGSGKTFTITQRILYLIEKMKVPPEEILVITFTKEAALSMQHRFLEQSNLYLPVNFGTFHSVFYHILNQSQISSHKKIMGETQKKSLLYSILTHYLPNAVQQKDVDIASLLSAISYFKNTGDMKCATERAPSECREMFHEILSAYEHTRKKSNSIDFDDMIYECAELLHKNKEVQQYWQGRFSHILMDEFQDICPMQYRVVKLLSKPPYNLFAVGDDDQAIYGFRGSNPKCLMQFAADYQAKQILLNVNYRSCKAIVEVSGLVISENKERFQKVMIAEKDEENERNNISIRTFTGREEQYHYLTQVLSEINNNDTCAVLFRTNSYMQGFAVRLQQEGIDFTMKERVNNIYQQYIVQDIMAYLRLAAGENLRKLWLRIMNKPSRYISREALAGEKEVVTLEEIQAYYKNMKPQNPAFLYLDKIRSSLEILEQQLTYLRNATPFIAVQYVRRVIGYDKAVPQKENVIELLEWLSEDAKNYRTLPEWLKAQKEYEEKLKVENTGNTSSKIQLMTVHAAKGLEFDHVWIPDCNEKIFPHGSMPDKEACEEERRIFYVAMTRAKKNLELLSLIGTKERPRFPSRFLNPLWKYYSSSSTTSSNSH